MTKFEEVLETILEEYARRDTEGDFDTWEETDSFVKEKAEVLLAYANLQKEPVSEDLDIAIGEYCSNPDNFITYIDVAFAYRSEQKDDIPLIIKAIKFGTNWQKENLWKSADGNDLPEIDKEVIVLRQPYPLEENDYAVSFAHRPNPKGWDGKSLTSGKVEHYTPKTYGKGGWNIPDIVYWLDVELPKEIEL